MGLMEDAAREERVAVAMAKASAFLREACEWAHDRVFGFAPDFFEDLNRDLKPYGHRIIKITSREGERPETGAIEFEGDWPGLFIRGDHAHSLAMMLDSVLQRAESGQPLSEIQQHEVRGLRALLGTIEGSTPTKLRRYTKCRT